MGLQAFSESKHVMVADCWKKKKKKQNISWAQLGLISRMHSTTSFKYILDLYWKKLLFQRRCLQLLEGYWSHGRNDSKWSQEGDCTTKSEKIRVMRTFQIDSRSPLLFGLCMELTNFSSYTALMKHFCSLAVLDSGSASSSIWIIASEVQKLQILPEMTKVGIRLISMCAKSHHDLHRVDDEMAMFPSHKRSLHLQI